MLKLENITYRYADNSQPALLNVSLEISTGEAVGVMGANGSGKSTFAKLAAGLIQSQQGRISWGIDKSVPIPVGLLFQNPDNQMVAVTVEKEIAFALENLGISRIEMEKRIAEMLKRFSIEPLRRRLTAELSVGEKQRVALAALLVGRPPSLMLDEPDSFLDRDGRDLFRRQLARIKKHSPELTIIEITQYPQVAREYERLIVFQNGRVAADSHPEKILQNRSLCLKCGLDFDISAMRNVELPGEGHTSKKRNGLNISKIAFERVSLTYPASEKCVLQHFSGEFNSEDITAIVGPSGSGKSTLGMLLCGIIEPDSGEIRCFDEKGKTIKRKMLRGQITAALQQPERQFFLQSCEQEVEFGPRNFGRPILRRAVQSFFRLVGLPFEQFFDRDPFTLSLGEKRRLAFASILSMTPNFIIFDEPTCALDREGVGRFILLARALHEADVGVVIISHDEELINALAVKIIALDGRGNFRIVPREEYFEKDARSSSAVAN